MDNPFNSLEARLSNIENLLLDIKHEKKQPQSKEPQVNNGQKLLTADQVCERLAVTRQTLHKWKLKNWLNPVKIGYAVRWRESDISAIQKEGIISVKES